MLERQGRSGQVKNIDVVYTRGAVQLARLGRESPLGEGGESGAALQGCDLLERGRAIDLHEPRPVADEPGGPKHRPRSPTIGTEAGADGRPASDEAEPSDG